MSVITHESRWRLLVGAAPLIGVAFFVWAAALGEADVTRSSTARAILAAVAALGAAVAWWTARELRAAPAVSVSTAAAQARSGPLAGIVALHGRARALPDAVPLVSPDGELCLWFRGGERGSQRDSVRPFLLVDDSGECVVLPAGAEMSGHQQAETPECLLRDGDPIRVTGRFVALPESLVLQAQAASLLARDEATQAPARGGEPLSARDPRPAALAGAAPQTLRHGLPLPVIAAPEAGQPLSIRIGPDGEDGGVYGVLAVADCLVLLVSSSLAAWAMLVPA